MTHIGEVTVFRGLANYNGEVLRGANPHRVEFTIRWIALPFYFSFYHSAEFGEVFGRFRKKVL